MVTFPVDDDLALPTERCETYRLADAVGDALAFGGDPELPVVDHGSTHPLLGAVHRAFAEHRPLVLSPDAIWLTIAQGVAQHVRLHAEALRPRLVRHDGKRKLAVTCAELPSDPGAWSAVIARFRDLLGDELGDGRARLLECDFSTTGEIELTASRIVLMDAMAPYFTYEMTCICGIPAITLTGTPDDWRRIRAKVDVIAELDLTRWCRSLAPMADQWIAAASGHADRAFWRRIYKPQDAYGGDVVTGWIGRLYPYLEGEGRLDWPNPLLDLPLDEPRDDRDGISPRSVPSILSSVDVDVIEETGRRSSICLEAGLVAVAQDAEGRLVPTAGWIARPAVPRIADLAARIREEHDAELPAPAGRLEGSAEVIALFAHLGGATIHGWRLYPPAQHLRVDSGPWVRPLIDLPDGTFIGYTRWFHDTVYVRGVAPAPRAPYGTLEALRNDEAIPASALTVVGASLGVVLAWALDHAGSLELPSSGTLEAWMAARR